MKLKSLALAAAAVSALAGTAPAFAQAKEQFIPVLSYRTGAYAPNGAPWALVDRGAWEPAAFWVDQSVRLLFMVIMGGLGSIMGAFFGAAFITVLPIVLNQALPVIAGWFGAQISTVGIAHAELMIFGGLIVWFLIVEPHGLAKLWSTGKQKLRLWPFPH